MQTKPVPNVAVVQTVQSLRWVTVVSRKPIQKIRRSGILTSSMLVAGLTIQGLAWRSKPKQRDGL